MAFDVPVLPPAETAPAQRAFGCGRLAVRAEDGRTRLQGLYQEGSAKLRLPRARGASLEAVMINSAGGMTGGDRFAWTVEVGAGGHAVLTTQACERVYRASADTARVEARLTLEAGARLDWLPQETILFDGSALSRTITADLADDAALLLCEAVILGRHAMGETFARGAFHDRWRIRRAGRLVFADDLRLEGEIPHLIHQSALLGGAGAFATLLLVSPDAGGRIDAVRAAADRLGGASAFDDKLVVRLAAADGLSLRRALIPTLRALGATPPAVWTL